jgi:pyrroline-5-carboxylate reductase
MKTYQIGILGAGHMGAAIARGAVKSGFCAPNDLLLYNQTPAKRAAFAEEGFAVCTDLTEVYTRCRWMVLGVRPQSCDEVLSKLGTCVVAEKPLVLSIAAGVPFAKIEEKLGADTAIIRLMPNTPLILGEGATALVKNRSASAEQLLRVQQLFDRMGVTVCFDREEQLNDVIPYNGSAPAYLYFLLDAMAKSAQTHGIAYEDALRLLATTCVGAAKLVLTGEQSPAQLIDAVCSPGGTTIEAVKVLREGKMADILAEASDACIRRAYELGK